MTKKSNNQPWPADEVQRLRDLREAGHSAAEIARLLGRSVGAVWSKAHNFGLSIPDPRRAAAETKRRSRASTNSDDVTEAEPRPESRPLVKKHRCMICRVEFLPRYRGEWYCSPGCREVARVKDAGGSYAVHR